MILQRLVENTHYGILCWSWLAMVVAAIVAWRLGRRLSKVPTPVQAAAEVLTEQIQTTCGEACGFRSQRCIAVFGGLFMAAVVSAILGVVPIRAASMGALSGTGIELGGRPFRDVSGDDVWQPGEPLVEGGQTDWGAMPDRPGMLLPSRYDRFSGANIAMELSLASVVLAGASLLLGRSISQTRERMKGMSAIAFPRIYPGILAGSIRPVVRALWRPAGGALAAIGIGGIAYNVVLLTGHTFMLEIGIGVFEVVLIALVVRKRAGIARKTDTALVVPAEGA